MAPTVSNITVGLQTDNTVKLGLYGTAEGSCTELGFTEGGIEISNARELFNKTAQTSFFDSKNSCHSLKERY